MSRNKDEKNKYNNIIKNLKKKKGFRALAMGVALTLVIGVSVYAGNRLTAFGILPITSVSAVQSSLEKVNDTENFKKVLEIREMLYRWYDGEIDDSKLAEGAIKGMVSSLGDQYTYYMNGKEFSDFKEKSQGNYMGIGIQVAAKDGKIVVISPIQGGPAEKAGIKTGDVILKVNGEQVSGNELDKAVSMMKGTTKENIKLTLYREGKGEFDVDVMRDVIKTVNVKSEMIDGDIGYIEVLAFDEGTAKDFETQLKALEDKGIKGLILDLRGNPGGFMKECVDLVSNFVPKDKVIVSTIDKYGNKEESISKGGIAQGMPLVVLIDGGTASASEIVAGAIRDYDLGTLVGTTSFGKGIVQVVLDKIGKEKDGTALKVTISKYYTPNGENIHKKGIGPDVTVEYPKELKEKTYSRSTDPQFEKALEIIQEKIK
ncbi:TPA: S41 family peptidase [Clostridium perfringens]|uniref:S41 family peptidase n=1 Tax=Clostridium perfringens TaxID=1502 RepID=UPI000F535758|nr:S41 family peptidase [Clostridium perfringens]EJT6341903.1 S41 family peptidase [Clostridium perfringens]ELQ0172216.1 S41 family peptidase [Clostridium perfringens]UBK97968.1 S41 family peptidase [Clostridium perfringens]CAJ1609867.1 Carboxy-terminal processing protease CtpA [Clostridium perfringens]BDC00587.1 peptidase S41 [Clostridium perfringens E]